MTNTELETCYLALCKRVKEDAMNIMGMAGVGRSEDAAIAALTLCGLCRNYCPSVQDAAGTG